MAADKTEVVKRIVEHFTGKKHGILKVNAGGVRIKIDFGRIVVPSVEGLEEFGKVKPGGLGMVEVTPKIVQEIIERDGALFSGSEEHREQLAKWLMENLPKILKLLKR